jgi:hypothetical protein
MNLGQMLLVIGAIALLGILIVNANTAVYETHATMANSEFGITAVSIATSVIEEAGGKMFDNVIADSNAAALFDSTLLTSPASLGPEAGESYRHSTTGKDFNDIDDFNGLFLVYKSDAAAESTKTPGSSYEFVLPGIRAKYFARVSVDYVRLSGGQIVASPTVPNWHKRMRVTVTSTGSPDTLVYPSIMSYWN